MNTTKPKPLLIGSQTGKKRELSSPLIGAITGSYFRCGSFTHTEWEGLLNKTDEDHVAVDFSIMLEADFYLFFV